VELPYIFFALALFVIPFYFMVGMASDGSLFFKFYLAVYVQAITYSFLSQLWMALCPSQISSNIINGLFMSLFFMFGGLFITPAAIPHGWQWFHKLDPVTYSFLAAMIPQLFCEGPDCQTITVTPGNTETVWNYVSVLFATGNAYWVNIGWLVLILAVIRVLNLIALKTISHIKR